MKRNIAFALMIVLSISLFAQRYTIKGQLLDKQTNDYMMFANCVLHYQTDTLGIYKGETSDTAGRFVFTKVKKRNLILEITYVGYKPYKKNIPASDFKDNKIIDLGTILLERQDDLQQVEIVAQRKRIEVDDDKLMLNIDEQMAGSVENAFDLLRLVPGVMIDNDENIQLNGKSGVQFQYNGREMKMDWEGVKDMLKSMTPDMIDQFEILKNPGVRYDAEGTAGIINIKLKKNQNYGINGSLSLNGGYRDKLNYSFSPNGRLNFVNDKWIVTLGYGYNRSWRGNYEGKDTTQRYIYRNEDTTLFRTIPDKSSSWSERHHADFTASYSLDTIQTISLNANYSYNTNPWSEDETPVYISHSPNYYAPDSMYSNLRGSNRNGNRFMVGLGWVKKLNSREAKLSSDLDFSYNDNKSSSENAVNYYTGSERKDDYLLRSQGYKRITENNSKNISWRIDYFNPISRDVRFEAGLKTNYSFSDRDYNAYVLDGENYVNDEMLTNQFKYTENINSLYASITGKFFQRKLSLRAGIRFEQTNTKGEQVVLDSVNTRHYFNIFPNLRASYKFSDDNELSLNYSYRIRRPWSESLNPFVSKSSDYSYSSGNPYLEPQYAHNISLSHSWKYMLFTTISYSYNKNDINWLSSPLDSTIYAFDFNPLAEISMPVNFGSSQDLDMNMSFNKSITQTWTISADAGANYQKVFSSTTAEEINRDNWSWNFSFNTFVTLPNKIRLSAFYRYNSSSLWGNQRHNAWNWFNASVGKSFFEDKLSMNLSVNWSLGQGGYSESEYMNTLIKSWHKADAPNFRLSLRYKFGKFYQNKQVRQQQLQDFDERTGEQGGKDPASNMNTGN